MSKVIYWKKFRKPKKVFDPIMQVEREINGKYVCTDERVAEVGLLGYLSDSPKNNTMGLRLEMLFKNGNRKSFIAKEIHNKIDEELISEAETFLKNL